MADHFIPFAGGVTATGVWWKGSRLMAKPTHRENDRRIEQLERLFEASEAHDPKRRPIDPDFVAIEEEFCSLAAAPHWRAGVRIEPKDEVREFYGRDYTQREHFELAVARGLERRGYSTAQIADQMGKWMAMWDEIGG
jgi:hypothetical protein